MMQNESQYFHFFFDQLLNALREKLTIPLDKAALHKLSQKLIEENMPLAIDKASIVHIETCSIVIVVFRYLRDRISSQESIDAIRYAFVDSLSFVTSQTEEFLNQASDPFKDMVDMSKQKEKEFGDGFEFYRKRDDNQAYLLEVKKCFFCKLLTSNEAHELMPVFCDFDTLWMKAIKPEKHGFKFERLETIGTGGNLCKFYFTKTN